MRAPVDVDELERFRQDVRVVGVRRDLSTAIEYGVRLNRLVSQLDRQPDSIPDNLRPLLSLAHLHIKAMVDCPRRMRLDETWPDDFVDEATKATNVLISLLDSWSD